MKFFLLKLCAILFVFLVTGCAGFHSTELAKISGDSLSRQSSSKPQIYLSVVYDGNMEMRRATKMAATVREEFDRAVRVADCCMISANETDSDLTIKAKIYKYENPAALVPAILTGLSLYTIPSWATLEYTLKANVTTKSKQSFNYEIQDSWTLLQWLPMMFVFPAYPPNKAEESVFRNLNEHLLYQLHQDKLI